MLTISTRSAVHMSRKTHGLQCASASGHSAMGMATMAKKKTLFMTFVDHDKRFKAHSSQFFADSDRLDMLTSCSEA